MNDRSARPFSRAAAAARKERPFSYRRGRSEGEAVVKAEAGAEGAAAKRSVPTPREIYAGLEEHVVGQHSVKMALSVAVHNRAGKGCEGGQLQRLLSRSFSTRFG